MRTLSTPGRFGEVLLAGVGALMFFGCIGTVSSTPSGARAYNGQLHEPKSQWNYIGRTPAYYLWGGSRSWGVYVKWDDGTESDVRRENEGLGLHFVKPASPGSPAKTASDYYQSGWRKVNDGDNDAAIADLTRAIQLKPDYPEAYLDRGVAYARLGSYAKAKADYTTAIRLKPDYQLAFKNRASLTWSRNEPSMAIADFTRALELKPEDTECLLWRALAYLSLEEYTKTIADCTKLLHSKPDDVDALAVRARAYALNGLYEEALSDVRKSIALGNDTAELRVLKADVYAHQGNYEDAIAEYSKGILIDPQPPYYCSRGRAYAAENNIKSAIADFTKAIDLDPELDDAYFARAAAYAESGAVADAVSDWRKVTELNPECWEAYMNLAVASRRNNDIEGAIAHHTEAIRIRPDKAEGYQQRAIDYMLRGNRGLLDKALLDFDRAIEIDPKTPSLYAQRAEAHDLSGNVAAAIADLSKAIELAPKEAAAYNSKAWLLIRIGDCRRALTAIDKALDIDARADYYDTRGWANFHLGNYDAAEKDALAASRLGEDFAYAWPEALLFRIRVARGNVSTARAKAREAIEELSADSEVTPLLEYYLGEITLEELKSEHAEHWSNYDVAVRDYDPSVLDQSGEGRALAAAAGRSADLEGVARRWALVVAVSQYSDSRVPVVRYAARDAQEFAGWLTASNGGGYAPADVNVLVNEDATAKNIRDALFNWARQALPEDILTIYMACHGTPESPDSEENLFLLPYDTDYANIAATAFPMWDIKTALERFVKAKRVVIIADVCHSGGIGEPFTIARRGVSGIAPSMLQKGVSDLAGVREGVLVFSSAQGGQLSQEGAQWGGGHGVFTYYLLDGLKGAADYDSNGSVTLGELVPYVQEKVRRETRDAQTPQASGRYDTNLSIAR